MVGKTAKTTAITVGKSNNKILNRKIYNYLRQYFASGQKALLISGARQVGKTYAIRKIGKECFRHVVEVNFLSNPAYKSAFQTPSDAKEILLKLSALTSKTLVPGKTLTEVSDLDFASQT